MSRHISKAAVIGSGTMGSGIAAYLMGAGLNVALLDIVPKSLTPDEEKKGLTLNDKSVRNRFALNAQKNISNPKVMYDPSLAGYIQIGNLEDDLDLLEDADWIIEVVVEQVEVKQQLMKKIAPYRKPGSIITTNTSGISVNSIVKDMPLEFRQHFLGTHFFNPARYMYLFEMIPTVDTLPEIVDFMKDFAERRLGKGVVMAKDTPNFVGNRIGTFALVMAINTVEKFGYSFTKGDMLLGPDMGRSKGASFKTIDIVGLDIGKHVGESTLKTAKNDHEKEILALPKYYYEMMEKGILGDKTKKGFFMRDPKTKASYEYDRKTGEYVPVVKEPVAVLEAVKKLPIKEKICQLVYGDSEESQFIWENTKELLLYTADHADEISYNYKDIDNALKWGYNYQFGPFELWDVIGLEKSIDRMEKEGAIVAAWVKERVQKGLKFYDESSVEKSPYIVLSDYKDNIVAGNNSALIKDIGDGVLCFELIWKGNTVNYDTTVMMEKAHELLSSDKYDGMVIGNNGPLFSGGFFLAEAVENLQKKDWNAMEVTLDRFHNFLLMNKYSKKPVVSAMFGSAMGGGMEIGIQTSYVVAHSETYMGLVEARVGLIPGGGGVKELAIRADELSNGGELNNFALKLWQDMATAYVTSSAFDALNRGFLRKDKTKIIMSKNHLISEAKKMVLSLNEDGFCAPIKKKVRVAGVAGKGYIDAVIDSLVKGNFATEYEGYVGGKIAHIITGGNVPKNALVTEEYLNQLEKEAFLSLLGEEKTIERINGLLNRKPVRN